MLLKLVEKGLTSKHPQLMLRRTESIVEKMLTNWLVGYHYLILLISLTFLIILIFLVMVLTNRLVNYHCLIISDLS